MVSSYNFIPNVFTFFCNFCKRKEIFIPRQYKHYYKVLFFLKFWVLYMSEDVLDILELNCYPKGTVTVMCKTVQ